MIRPRSTPRLSHLLTKLGGAVVPVAAGLVAVIVTAEGGRAMGEGQLLPPVV